jgi:hypothetical protein
MKETSGAGGRLPVLHPVPIAQQRCPLRHLALNINASIDPSVDSNASINPSVDSKPSINPLVDIKSSINASIDPLVNGHQLAGRRCPVIRWMALPTF